MRTNRRSTFSRRLARGTHSRQFIVDSGLPEGWQVREELDSQVLRTANYMDWHRVELAVRRFEMEALQLARDGWTEVVES